MARNIARVALGLLFIAAGVNHFLRPALYKSIMPGYLPWHGALVSISGYAEIGLGALVLVPRWQRPAGWGVIALLVAVFPANLHMALHAERFPRIPRWLLLLRLPLQALLIAWARWCTNAPAARAGSAE